MYGIVNDFFQMIPAKVDEFGREVEKAVDTWLPRRGVALCLAELAALINLEHIGELVNFFVSTALADRSETVRKEMLNAALKVVDLHGKVIQQWLDGLFYFYINIFIVGCSWYFMASI